MEKAFNYIFTHLNFLFHQRIYLHKKQYHSKSCKRRQFTNFIGKKDQLTPLSLGENLHKIIKNSILITLPDVGHIPMVDNHDLTVSIIKNNI